MRSDFGWNILSASITVMDIAQAQKHPQRPPGHGYVETPMGY